jgi:hypothetical protein
MVRKLAAFVVAGVLAGGVVASNLTPAQATHTLAHLRRQIDRLENQVRVLRNEVFNCERICRLSGCRPSNGSTSDGHVRRIYLPSRLKTPLGGPALPPRTRAGGDSGATGFAHRSGELVTSPVGG